ncbi:hypothetical protein [Antrihabitans cavernicola]|uniref:Integral membrane protein n=1 Tax=Antrihabitans cavernicola TaxID=2495913 RepID=A0A5A7S9Z1_9NOCA|nr:hypothetical protein [Spelaeibacter cavernicola]KAA0021992.1 hypothetical protein FOY51_16555 [Spelaeibacter cavernicola]
MTFAERAYRTAAGLLMVAAALPAAPTSALPAAAAGCILVMVSLRYRIAAVPAVFATIATLVIGYPPPPLAALSGLAAAIYLLTLTGLTTLTRPTLICSLACTAAALAMASIPITIAWLPVVAPIVAVLIFAGLARPFQSR